MLFLSDLSIIIPTYNRQEYVLRNMCYWSNYDLTVHVLDGTKTPIPSNKLTKLGAKINYHHMPIPLMERLYKSIELVSTKYSMMMGDDEFYIPSALESCIILLDKDEEYISCIGAAISFKVENSKVTSNVKYPCLKNSALMQNIPVDRATYHMKNYCPSIVYSVMRTDAWKKSMRALSYNNYEVYVMSIGELQFEIAGSYLGKTAVINELSNRSNQTVLS